MQEMQSVVQDLDADILTLEEFPEITDIPETGETLQENALIKARLVNEFTGFPAIGDDTGLEVMALDGAPGVYSARYAGENVTYMDNVKKLLSEMSGIENRQACFRTATAFVNGKELKIIQNKMMLASEKMAMGHIFDGYATLVVGTHTHVPTNDGRVLNKGTAYLTDAGMCGDYNSVIGMNTQNSLNRFFKRDSSKHYPAEGEASLCGVMVEANHKNGLAKKINSFIFGGELKNIN